jgi:hypothetical protein
LDSSRGLSGERVDLSYSSPLCDPASRDELPVELEQVSEVERLSLVSREDESEI